VFLPDALRPPTFLPRHGSDLDPRRQDANRRRRPAQRNDGLIDGTNVNGAILTSNGGWSAQ
jgi:hypothetical protein